MVTGDDDEKRPADASGQLSSAVYVFQAKPFGPDAVSKFVSNQQILGEKGVALVSQIVFDMGFVWRANTALDAGIDGHIELRDPKTGIVGNRIVQVQVKATEVPLNEHPDYFDFRVEQRSGVLVARQSARDIGGRHSFPCRSVLVTRS